MNFRRQRLTWQKTPMRLSMNHPLSKKCRVFRGTCDNHAQMDASVGHRVTQDRTYGNHFLRDCQRIRSCSGQIASARVPAYVRTHPRRGHARRTAKPPGNFQSLMTMDSRKLTKLAKTLRGRRIAVAGDFMLDRYTWGSANRLSPEAPVPVVDFMSESQVLGGAGNVAANLAALGATVFPFGVVGEDEAGSAIRSCLGAAGIATKGIVADASRITTVKTRIVARHQQIVRVDRERREPLSRALEDNLIRRIKTALGRLDALVISDYDKGFVTDALADRVLSTCHDRGIPVLVKPKTSRLFAYRGATVIVCNAKEAGFFDTRSLDSDESVAQAGHALLAKFGCSAVVITRGAEGLNVFEDTTKDTFHVPATSREISYAGVGLGGTVQASHGRQVFDVTGAGDTVLSVLALAVAARIPIREAAVLANAGAGVVVGKLGTSTITPDELFAALRDPQ
jgi:rfaE bifunctional protein kinase chain/domain